MEGDRVEQAMRYAAERIGIPSLNEKQKEAVRAFVGGKDVFVSLPTGFGKSVCFQSVLFVFDPSRCLVQKVVTTVQRFCSSDR